MKCRCDELIELNGSEATEYAEAHLVRIRTDSSGWVSEFECPLTGYRWVKDYPCSNLHGGGNARLRRSSTELD